MKPTPLERLLARVEDRDGCLIFHGKRVDGYGHVVVEGRHLRAHRVMYEAFVGPVPTDHHLHHHCEQPSCVNPAHLEPLTPSAHARLSPKARQTYCVNGHEFTPENTIVRSNGTRRCKACQNARSRAYGKKNRARLSVAERALRAAKKRPCIGCGVESVSHESRSQLCAACRLSPHGTTARYQRRCRCEACRAANAAAHRAYMRRRRAAA